jgi:hypothetical protein
MADGLSSLSSVCFFSLFYLMIKHTIYKSCLQAQVLKFKIINFMFLKTEVTPTYLLTPWSRVLLEKLTVSAASQIPRIFVTQRFLTILTSARHMSLS